MKNGTIIDTELLCDDNKLLCDDTGLLCDFEAIEGDASLFVGTNFGDRSEVLDKSAAKRTAVVSITDNGDAAKPAQHLDSLPNVQTAFFSY